MKYPILYKSNETDFFTLGLGPVEMLKATVTQERNGIFIFEGEILTDNPLFPLVLENYIIKADADHLLKDQRFRIKRIVPNHDGKAQIYAEHVSYLSRELTIKPEVNVTGSAQIALNQWKSSIVESNPFVVSSDITTTASTKWRIDKVENPMMALGGVEGSILDRWGGEYLFDNYHISLLKKRGKTATNILAYGRNITDFEQERNILSTYTSIAPYAIYTNDSEKEIVVTVDGFVVDSEHVNKFPNRVTKPIDFSSEFGSDEIPTKARLTTLAQQYIADNEIGVPTTSIKISFLDLSQTSDYADYAFLEQVNLCDDVRVHYPKLGVNTIAKVVRVVWNCLTESYDEIEIGQKRMSLASQIQEQNKVIQEINTQTNQAQVSADGKNMIFYGLYGENGLGEPNAIKIGDSWFKPNGLETELYAWTGIEWKLIMSTSSFNEINETIEDLDTELGLTTTTANDAVNKAEQAIRDIGFANSAIEAADGKISSLEQNLDGFQQVVQNTYADKTTVTALATQWTQTTELANGHTSAINSLGESINLRVTKEEVDEKILADKMIKDTRNDNQPPTWYYINYPKQKAYELKYCATIGIPTGFYASVVTEVPWDDASGGTVEQRATTNDGVYQRRGTTTWSAWAKIADSSNIISQINISPESILIASAKIQIKGDTYIDNGVIKTAHIADLAVSGAKIANASIASAKIISLDASKITANTLSAITANTGNLNVSGNLSMTTVNSKISSSFDYTEPTADAYQPRRFVGTSNLSLNSMNYKGTVNWNLADNTGYIGYAESAYGLDFFKQRVYQNNSLNNLYYRIDMYNGKIELSKSWNLYSDSSTVIGYASVTTPHVSTTSVRTNRIVLHEGWGTFQINEDGAYDMPIIQLGGNGAGFIVKHNNNSYAELQIGRDGSNSPAVYVRRGIYDQTTSISSNMHIESDGRIRRSTSARKYKADITNELFPNAKKVLGINPASWLDKAELEREGRSNRYHGFIADEFDELGLTEVVQYGADGQVEGLAYDRISMYHHVILRDHEQQLSTVTQQLNTVSNNRLQETLLLESRLLSLQKTVEQLQQEIEQLK